MEKAIGLTGRKSAIEQNIPESEPEIKKFLETVVKEMPVNITALVVKVTQTSSDKDAELHLNIRIDYHIG